MTGFYYSIRNPGLKNIKKTNYNHQILFSPLSTFRVRRGLVMVMAAMLLSSTTTAVWLTTSTTILPAAAFPTTAPNNASRRTTSATISNSWAG
jgi:hypothetical protein